MARLRALASAWGAFAHKLRKDHLKLCFLWYDEVLVEPMRRDSRTPLARDILSEETLDRAERADFTDVVIDVAQRVSKDTMDAYTSSRKTWYPRWGDQQQNFTYPEPETAEEYAHNALLSHIEDENGHPAGPFFELWEGRARVATDAVALWAAVNQEAPCILQATGDEKVAMAAALNFNKEMAPVDQPFRLFELSVPSLAKVPWKEIIGIKRRGNFNALRTMMFNVLTERLGDLDAAQRELARLEEDAAGEIIDAHRPNLKMVAIESVFSNIPNIQCISIVNPFSVFLGIRNVVREVLAKRRTDWFYALHDVKQARMD